MFVSYWYHQGETFSHEIKRKQTDEREEMPNNVGMRGREEYV